MALSLPAPAWGAALLLVSLMSGCAVSTTDYRPSAETIVALRASPIEPVRVGQFVAAAGVADESLSIRGAPMSPPQGSYARFLGEALRAELESAKALDPKAPALITGTLLRNELDALSMVTGTGALEARFVITREGKAPLEVTRTVTHSWESAYFGGTALNSARENYNVMVQRLIRVFLLDPAVRSALGSGK